MADEDEAALNWLGDDELASKPSKKRAATAGASSDAAAEQLDHDDDEDEAPTGPSSLSLIVFGVFVGVYFLYALAWMSYAIRSAATTSTDPLAQFMFNLGLWLAVLAAPLWMIVTIWLVRRPMRRYLVLAIGLLVLVPVPLVWR